MCAKTCGRGGTTVRTLVFLDFLEVPAAAVAVVVEALADVEEAFFGFFECDGVAAAVEAAVLLVGLCRG